MNLFSQINSQVSTLFLFRRLFRPANLFLGALSLPWEYCLGNGKASFPLGINLLVTSRCNLKCVMCHFRDALNSGRETLAVPEIEKLIRSIAHKGPSIFLSGGEPFLRDDILDIVRVVKKHGLRCGLCTNGTLLNAGIIDKLIRLKIDNLVFSIHGSEEVHDRTVGLPGAYRICRENLRLVCAYKKRPSVIINSAAASWNINCQEDIVRLGKNAGVDGVRFEYLNFLTYEESRRQEELWRKDFPGVDVKTCAFRYDPQGTNDEYVNALRVRDDLKNKYGINIITKPRLSLREIENWYSQNTRGLKRKCLFIWRSLFISPAGDVYPCQFIMCKFGNIRQKSLADIWNSRESRRFRRYLRGKASLPVCLRCCKL